MDWTLAILIWTGSAVVAWWIARQKGAPDVGMWAVVGFLLGPIGVLLAIAFAKPGPTSPSDAHVPAAPGFCPQCGLPRAGALRFCGSCGYEFDRGPHPAVEQTPTTAYAAHAPSSAPPPAAADPSLKTTRRWSMAELGVVVLIIGAVVVGAAVLWSNMQTREILGNVASALPTVRATPEPTVALDVTPGVIEFGLDYDPDTLEIVERRERFNATTKSIAWSAAFSQPAGATTVQFIFAKVGAGGAESIVITTQVPMSDPSFDLVANDIDLAAIADNEAGTYVVRYVRDDVVLAEGQFELVE